MNSKVWLTFFGIVSAVVLIGAGFYTFSSFGKYSDAMAGWDAKVGTIQTLERKSPYPNEENAKAIEESVKTYKASVANLSQTLQTFNRPLNKTLANTEFQQRVKKRVEDFREVAKTGGLEIDSTTEFHLGFDIYANTLPSPALVPVLDYDLEAVDHLLRLLVSSGVATLSGFEREAIPGETGGAEKHESGVVHKYPVRFRFTGSYDAFQKFVNAIANDKEYFYILRVLKVKNAVTEGPLKLIAVDGALAFQRFENPTTKQVATQEMLDGWGAGTAPEAEFVAKAREAGFIKSSQDGRVLMGQENVSVFMVVDITRFLGPDEVVPEKAEPKAKKGGKR